jgi:hypothetical protein
MKILSILFFFMTNLLGVAQSPMHTLKTKRLEEVVVKGQWSFDIGGIPPVDSNILAQVCGLRMADRQW